MPRDYLFRPNRRYLRRTGSEEYAIEERAFKKQFKRGSRLRKQLITSVSIQMIPKVNADMEYGAFLRLLYSCFCRVFGRYHYQLFMICTLVNHYHPAQFGVIRKFLEEVNLQFNEGYMRRIERMNETDKRNFPWTKFAVVYRELQEREPERARIVAEKIERVIYGAPEHLEVERRIPQTFFSMLDYTRINADALLIIHYLHINVLGKTDAVEEAVRAIAESY
jgi:hypothetical protein